jgi:two-component system sensor histidine kinase YesM
MRSVKLFSLQNKFIGISLINAIIPILFVVGLSYTKSVEIIEGQVSQSNFNTLEQVANNIGLVFEDMKNSSVFLLQNKEFMNYLRLPEKEINSNPGYLLSARNFIHSYLAFNMKIHSIYLEAFNGLEFDSANAQNTIDDEQRRRLSLLRGEGILVPDIITNYNGSKTRVFSFVKMMKDIENLSSDLAILKINIAETEISKIYGNSLLSRQSKFFITDQNGVILSSLDEAELGTILPPVVRLTVLNGGVGGYYDSFINGDKFIIAYCDLLNTSWKLINTVPLYELSQDMRVIRSITILSIILSIVFCILSVAYFSLKVLSPLRILRKAMGKMEHENFDVNIQVVGNDEISLLAASFNKMSNKVRELIHEVLNVQIKQKEAELKALHAQINPHFLYNTLDMIYWTCRMEKAEESAGLIQTLSGLFRLSLNNGNEFTSLEKEIEHLKLYMALQQKRFTGMVEFLLNAPDDIMNCKVVKLILQPLVENAIIHGIEKKGARGTVEVKIYREGAALVYMVRDDGAGAEEDEIYSCLENVQDRERGFALNNVNERIKVYFGPSFGISFKTAVGSGMIVTVVQPLIYIE